MTTAIIYIIIATVLFFVLIWFAIRESKNLPRTNKRGKIIKQK